MKVTLTSSCSIEKDYMLVSPIDGDVYVDQESLKPGQWTSNLVLADVDDIDGSDRIVEVGTECKVYSEEHSGEGILLQKTIAYDGGGSSTPYKQVIYTFTGPGD